MRVNNFHQDKRFDFIFVYSAESPNNFYGFSYRAVGNKFSEDGFAKTGGPSEIDKLYKTMIGDSDKKS